MNLRILIDCCLILLVLFFSFFLRATCGLSRDINHYLLLLSLLLVVVVLLRMCAGASQLYLVCLLLEAIRIGHFL